MKEAQDNDFFSREGQLSEEEEKRRLRKTSWDELINEGLHIKDSVLIWPRSKDSRVSFEHRGHQSIAFRSVLWIHFSFSIENIILKTMIFCYLFMSLLFILY